jgi:hypothetical protein
MESRGVITAAPIVDTVVISTLRLTFPCATKVATLLAWPPGQEPRRIMPMATDGGSDISLEMVKAKMGSTEYWQTKPRRIGMGCLRHCRKSSSVSESPILSMRSPTPCSNCAVVIQLREPGKLYAVVAESNAQTGKSSCTPLDSFSSCDADDGDDGGGDADADADAEATAQAGLRVALGAKNRAPRLDGFDTLRPPL